MFGDPRWNAPTDAEAASTAAFADRQNALLQQHVSKAPPPALPTFASAIDPDGPVLKTKEMDRVIVLHYPSVTAILAWQTSLMNAVVTTSGEREYPLITNWMGQAYDMAATF